MQVVRHNNIPVRSQAVCGINALLAGFWNLASTASAPLFTRGRITFELLKTLQRTSVTYVQHSENFRHNDIRPLALWVTVVPAIHFTVLRQIAHSVQRQALCFHLDSILRTSPPLCSTNMTNTFIFNIKTLADTPTDCRRSLKTLVLLSGTSTWNTKPSHEVLSCAKTWNRYGRTKWCQNFKIIWCSGKCKLMMYSTVSECHFLIMHR